MTGARASHRASALTAERPASKIVQERSVSTRTGTCSSDRPRFAALPLRFQAFLSGISAKGLPSLTRVSTRSPLRLYRKKVSSASTLPFGFSVLVLDCADDHSLPPDDVPRCVIGAGIGHHTRPVTMLA